MSEAGPPETPVQGRQFGMGAPGEAPPAVLLTSTPTTFTGGAGVGPTRQPDQSISSRYSHRSITPIPFMLVAIALIVGAWFAVQWARWTEEAPGRFETSEWWTNVLAVLAPAEDLGLGAYSNERMWIALSLAMAAALASAVWIGRIGTNVRPGSGPFGSVLPLLAFPAWWVLPITINLTAEAGRGRYDVLIRYLVALGMLVTQYLIVRWPVTNRIWRAGRLPYDLGSVALWLPNMIPWLLLLCSNLYTVFVVGEGGDRSDSAWLPTTTMEDWARWTTRGSAIGLLVLLVVVSISQHHGISRDRAELEASRG
jgi:hypothetical protein